LLLNSLTPAASQTMRQLEPKLVQRLHSKLQDCTRRLANFQTQPEPRDERGRLVRRNHIRALEISINTLQKAIKGDGTQPESASR